MAKYPTFAVGKLEKIQPAIDSGVLTYPSYVFIEDDDKFAFIDKNLDIRIIVGNNPKTIERVDILPEIENAKEDVLYICNNSIYIFNETEFNPISIDSEAVKEDIVNLKERVSTLENSSPNIQWIEL